jgi:hypothetical protein
MEVFIPQKWANATNWVSPREVLDRHNIYKPESQQGKRAVADAVLDWGAG